MSEIEWYHLWFHNKGWDCLGNIRCYQAYMLLWWCQETWTFCITGPLWAESTGISLTKGWRFQPEQALEWTVSVWFKKLWHSCDVTVINRFPQQVKDVHYAWNMLYTWLKITNNKAWHGIPLSACSPQAWHIIWQLSFLQSLSLSQPPSTLITLACSGRFSCDVCANTKKDMIWTIDSPYILRVNTLRPRQFFRHFSNEMFKFIFWDFRNRI